MCRGQIDCELKEIYFNFFARFSRFEYCLKKHGFREQQNGWVKTNWQCFGSQFSCAYSDSEYSTSHKEEYLWIDPPRKLVRFDEQGNNVWESITANKSPPELTIMVCRLKRLRNNLFHGDKNSDRESDRQRDKCLLRSGAKILDDMAELANFGDDYKIVIEK